MILLDTTTNDGVGGTPKIAPLGNTAKSSSTFEKKRDFQTVISSIRTARQKRFDLLKSIRKLYLRAGTNAGLTIPAEFHRTTNCKHAMTGNDVTLNKCPDPVRNGFRGFYTGLQTCGSVWTCPLCSNRIQEVRRAEIATAMSHFYAVKKQAAMVTLTFPHTAANTLKELLKKQTEALTQFRGGRAWLNFKNSIGFEGLIRSLEITRGPNGWHPHTHELWFIDELIDEVEFINFVNERWLACCIKAGLVDSEDENKQTAFIKHSVDIKFNCNTSEYIAKFDAKENWGVDREIAKASSKKGKLSGMHPFELAFKGYDKLFLEYTSAIKGKSQLFWSRGLKDKVGINQVDDEDIAESESPDKNLDEVIGFLFRHQWKTVLRNDLRHKILELIEDGFDIVDIHRYIFKIESSVSNVSLDTDTKPF
jgi:hypothetical protein